MKTFLLGLFVALLSRGFAFSADLMVNSYTALAPGHYVYDTVTVNDTLLCQNNTGLNTGVVISCYNMIINTNGRIAADSQGNYSAQGAGKPVTGTQAGAGYGGHGADIGGGHIGGPSYGSIKNPSDLGSGATEGATAGGGLIQLIVTNELKVDGRISAEGTQLVSASTRGGPSGGTIFISANIVSGGALGKISANGGNGYSASYGAGAGGRIAIYYQQNTFTGSITAYSGTNGQPAGCGTIFMKTPGQTNGELVLDAGNNPSAYYTQIAENVTFDTIVFRNNSVYVEIPSGYTVNTTNISSDSNSSKLKVTGNLYIGSGTFSKLTIMNNGVMSFGGGNLVIDDGGILEVMNKYLTLNNLTIKSGGKLTHTSNYDGQKRYWLELTVNYNLTVESGGYIEATAKGYPTKQGPGAPIADRCGGSYGGYGSNYDTPAPGAPGPPYGSETMPVDLGSGGSDGPGGGYVNVYVKDYLTINGIISADGPNRTNGNFPGSGGSVLIKAPNILGNGKIGVQGGSQTGGGSPGAGGRMAIYYNVNNFTGTYDTAPGGLPNPAAQGGTCYKSQMTFFMPPRVPTLDNPSYSGPIPGKRPAFSWQVPTDQENDTIHFEIQISDDSSFSTIVQSALSETSPSGFGYSTNSGITWSDYPANTGVASNASPAIKVRYTCQSDLWVGDWYWRVRAKDVDGFGNWSDTGSLPSIIGDLVVKIKSPSMGGADSVATYSSAVKVEGVIEQASSQTISINGVPQNLLVTDNSFSVDVTLDYGKTTVMVTANGVIGNYLSDTVIIYRYKVPSTSSSANIGKSGGTVRIEDWDNDADNDARVEVPEGALDRDVPITIKSLDGDTPLYGSAPIYEIKVNNQDSFKFAKKIKIVLSYKNLNARKDEEDKLRIFYWDGVKWQLVGGEVNKEKKTVSCYTNHTSKYAVMVLMEVKDVVVTVSPEVFTPNSDGINDMAVFNFAMKNSGKIEIRVYESTGKVVRVITDDNTGLGTSIAWDGLDSSGKLLETGLYYYIVFVSGKQSASGTIAIAK